MTRNKTSADNHMLPADEYSNIGKVRLHIFILYFIIRKKFFLYDYIFKKVEFHALSTQIIVGYSAIKIK